MTALNLTLAFTKTKELIFILDEASKKIGIAQRVPVGDILHYIFNYKINPEEIKKINARRQIIPENLIFNLPPMVRYKFAQDLNRLTQGQ